MKSISVALLAVYVLFRMAADPFIWSQIPEYYSYAFEILFVAVAYFIFRNEITLWKKPGLKDLILTLVLALAGFFVYGLASPLQVPVPFDLSEPETIFLLIGLGPVLEELIFRMALWQALQNLFASNRVTLLATTVLFAIGHFIAYWIVPEQFQGFIIYQSIYVLLLGAVIGWRRGQTGAISSGILLHIGFNVGFLLGGKL